MAGKNSLRVDGSALEGITQGPLPGSRKIYVEGALHKELRVPMREIQQTATHHGHGSNAVKTENPPICVYDPSGPYTDPTARIDLKKGLEPLRASWISSRADTHDLPGLSSEYGRMRLQDPRLDGLRFHTHRRPRVGKPGKNVSQLHYARKG